MQDHIQITFEVDDNTRDILIAILNEEGFEEFPAKLRAFVSEEQFEPEPWPIAL